MKKILIAEDDVDLRHIIRDLLKDSGFATLEAEDGKQVLVHVKREVPDLLVLDLAMPEMDGWQVAHALRLSPASKDLPILALTAHAMPGDRKRALDAGCNSYLPKPFLLADLLTEIQNLLLRVTKKN